MINVLFTCAGRRTYLIEQALELSISKKYAIRVFVSDSDKNAAAFWVSPQVTNILVPKIDIGERDYIDFLLEKCKSYEINMIIPLMDFEIVILSKYKDLFETNNITVVVSTFDFVTEMLDKEKTFDFCTRNNLNYPKSFYTIESVPIERAIVRKQILGSGSVGLSFHDDKTSLTDFEKGRDMVQIKIEGDEYGIDILNDLSGNFLHAAFRKKIAMRSGETDKAEVIFDENLWHFAQKLSKTTKHIGNLDIDIITPTLTEEDIYIIDINPRFGGGYPFTYCAGFNYLSYLFDAKMNITSNIPKQGKHIIGMKGIKMFFYEQ